MPLDTVRWLDQGEVIGFTADDRRILIGLLDYERQAREFPMPARLRHHVRATDSDLRMVVLRGLAFQHLDRYYPTRNGLRAAGDPRALEILAGLVVPMSLMRQALQREQAAWTPADLAERVSGLDADAAGRVATLLMKSCFQTSLVDKATGALTRWEVDERILDLNIGTVSGERWEFFAPWSAAQLVARFQAGETTFAEAHVVNQSLARAQLDGLVIESGNLIADLSGASLRGSTIGSAAGVVHMPRAHLVNVDFRNATLQNIAARYAYFNGADLRDASFGEIDIDWAVVEGAKFTSSSHGLHDKVLARTQWSWVEIDGQRHGRGATASAQRPQPASHDPADAPSRPTRLRIQGEPAARVWTIHWADLERADRRTLGLELIRALQHAAGKHVHVLDLITTMDPAHVAGLGPMTVDDARARVRKLAQRRGGDAFAGVELSGREGTKDWERVCACLRRVEFLTSPAALRPPSGRKPKVSKEQELEELEAVLRAGAYKARTLEKGSDPIERARGRVNERYTTAVKNLIKIDRAIGPYLTDAIDPGEFWLFVEPA